MDGLTRLHPISRRHLETLSGDLGIMQHARGTKPDPAHGYCVDDVARSLEVDLLHARGLGWFDDYFQLRQALVELAGVLLALHALGRLRDPARATRVLLVPWLASATGVLG